MLEADQHFKATVIKMLQWAVINTLETNEGKREHLMEEIEISAKEER